MKQEYVRYELWEDFINGMWRKVDKIEEKKYLEEAIYFTGDHMKYGIAMKSVVVAWPNTMINSLTNNSINKRAFVGHCACCYEFSCPEYITRAAWRELTNEQRYKADLVAQQTIDKWLFDYARKDRKIHTSMGEQVLF